MNGISRRVQPPSEGEAHQMTREFDAVQRNQGTSLEISPEPTRDRRTVAQIAQTALFADTLGEELILPPSRAVPRHARTSAFFDLELSPEEVREARSLSRPAVMLFESFSAEND